MNKKLLVFDLFADFGQIKKVFTTMSPLSFPFLSRTALQGVIGAILGIDKQINPESFIDKEVYLGLGILNPVKKIVIPHNNLKVISKKHFSRFEQHKPTNIEFLKDLKYRIYFTAKDQILYENLRKQLRNHLTVYTITIGISQCLANYEFQGEFDFSEKTATKIIAMNSVCEKNFIDKIDFGNNKVFTVKLPVRMKNDREVVEYKEYVYESDGAVLHMNLNHPYIKVGNGDNIVFL